MSPVEELARRIQLGWINPRGMIRVTCGGEPDRRELEARLRTGLPGPWLDFTFLAGAAPQEEIARLVAAANEVAGRVLSIDGLLNADGQINKPLLDAINFRREDITRPNVRQIWWLTPALADHFVSHMPDFESWFLYRFEVKERVAERHVAPYIRTAPVVAVDVADLEQRAVIALARGQDRESVIGDLILPAMTYLGQTGSGEEAWRLADRVGVAVDLGAWESPERWVAESGLQTEGLERFARMLAATRGIASGIEMVSRVAHCLEQQLGGQANADRRAKAAGEFTELGQFQYNEWRGVEAARSCFQSAYRVRLADAALEPRNRQLQIDLASTETWLGLVALHQRQWAEAERHYREALRICVEFNDRHSQASTFHQLGMVAGEQRQWAEAEGHYRQALRIKVEFNDRYSQASTYHQLGMVAAEQRQWVAAERHYREALRIKVEFNDRYSQAITYHQLGIVAQDQGQWTEAEGHYREALRIFVEFNDRHSQASTYGQLGMVAGEQRQWAEAEGHYRQALGIFVDFNDRHSQANTYHQLGRVAEEQGQWAKAAGLSREALRIYVEFNDRYSQAGTYHQLGRVAEEQRQWAETQGHYREALRIYVEFQDPYHRDMVLQSLSRLVRESGGDSVIALVAEVLGVPVDEARGLLAAAEGPGSGDAS